MTFTSDNLADNLVETFNAIAGAPVKFRAENPPEEILIEAEVADWKVYVWPFSETESSLDRGDMCREELICDVYIHGPISEKINRKKGIELCRVLRLSLRETAFSGFEWEGNETVDGVFDSAVLSLKNQFLSMFRTTYYNFG